VFVDHENPHSLRSSGTRDHGNMKYENLEREIDQGKNENSPGVSPNR
jgi:hypothetical protein